MKFGILKQVVLVMALSSSALAATSQLPTQIQKGDQAVYVAKVDLQDVSPQGSRCPGFAKCLIASNPIATLRVYLKGCSDRLVSVSYNLTAGENGKTTINVAAIAMATKASQTAHCVATPIQLSSAFLNSDSSSNPADVKINDLSVVNNE